MLNQKIIYTIERNGCKGPQGRMLYGTAALLHFLRLMNRPIDSISPSVIERGKHYVEKMLRV
jgi:hypothetical protein